MDSTWNYKINKMEECTIYETVTMKWEIITMEKSRHGDVYCTCTNNKDCIDFIPLRDFYIRNGKNPPAIFKPLPTLWRFYDKKNA